MNNYLENNEIEFIRLHSQSIEKYNYYFIAGNASAIAFSISQTYYSPLLLMTIPLLIAIICWAYGFYSGCNSLNYSQLTYRDNVEILRIQQGRHEMANADPEKRDIIIKLYLEKAENHSELAGRYSNRQFPAILTGAIFFIIWHLIQMAMLNPKIVLWVNSFLN